MHIMLDLETWGTTPGADIRSIGACVFDPVTSIAATCDDDDPQSFYIACDNPQWEHSDIRKHPLTRDPQTAQWWSEQSDEAQAAFADPCDTRDALERFSCWLLSIANGKHLLVETRAAKREVAQLVVDKSGLESFEKSSRPGIQRFSVWNFQSR